MATVTAEASAYTGLNATYNAASGGGDKVKAGGNAFLHVKNGSGVSVTCTLDTPGTVGGLAVADPVTTIPAGEERFIGPLDVSVFADPADSNLVDIAWSATTSVTFAAVYLP